MGISGLFFPSLGLLPAGQAWGSPAAALYAWGHLVGAAERWPLLLAYAWGVSCTVTDGVVAVTRRAWQSLPEAVRVRFRLSLDWPPCADSGVPPCWPLLLACA